MGCAYLIHQFLNQAPENDIGIENFCAMNFNTQFLRFKKNDVNGEKANPFFTYLKEELPEDVADEYAKIFEEKVNELQPVEKEGDIKWNFTKFLIDKEGNPFRRYSTATKPSNLTADIEKLLIM